MFQEQMAELDRGLTELIATTLKKIREKCISIDHVLDDKNSEFEEYFLTSAKNRLSDAYRGYVFTAKIERDLFDDDVIFIEDPAIKSECTVDLKPIPLADQEMVVSQSNANDKIEDNSEDVSSTETPESDPDVMKFYCTHCQDGNFRKDMYNNVQEVHNHWLMKHAKLAPFQFYAGYSCICIVCKDWIRISEIRNHFQEFHPRQQLGMANRLEENKCAICEYIGVDLADHFLANHQIVIDADLFNPMRLTKDDIQYLTGIEVHKKFGCTGCSKIFETKHQAIGHKCPNPKRQLKDFYDKNPPYFECGLCGCHMQRSQLKKHFSEDHDFECWNCDLVEANLNGLIVHHNEAHNGLSMEKTKIELGKAYFQTKIIFGNGLILNNANILSAGDNEYDKIQEFFEKQSSTSNSMEKISTVSFVDLNANATPESVSNDDLTEDEKRIDLELQKKLLTSVVVHGIDNDQEFQDIFLKLCKHIKVSIDSDDIQYTKKLSSNAVAVKFRERSKKELVLNAINLKGLKSDDFLQLPPGRKAEPIYINPRLTKIYIKITQKARFYLQEKKIQSYRICSQGCAVKMITGSYEHHVRSVKELDDFVEGKIPYPQKRKCTEGLQSFSPKRNKCT